MIRDPGWLLNPFANPILEPVLLRAVLLFIAGFGLVVALNGGWRGLLSSNLGRRYMAWLGIAPFYLTAVFLGGTTSLLFLLCVLLVAVWEYSELSGLPDAYTWSLYWLAALSVYVTSYLTSYFYSLPVIYFLTLTATGIASDDESAFEDTAAALFFAVWVIFSMCHFIRLGHLNNTLDFSKSLLVLIGFAVPLSDIGAYVVGKWVNKRGILDTRIARRISPNKSYGGVVGNVVGAGLGIWIMWFAVKDYAPLWAWVGLAVVIGVHAVLGDLTESMVKRSYGADDSGTLIPGHGGVLDRMDSSLRVILAVFYILQFIL